MVTAACVGRDREIDVLSTRLRTVSGAELIAISGNPGCGKSTLLTHLVQYHLAVAYERAGRLDEALAQFKRVVEIAGPADTREQIATAREAVARLQTSQEQKPSE